MFLKKLRRKRWLYLEKAKIKKQVETSSSPKVIIGAGTTSYEGWIKTDYPFFDITSAEQWSYIFGKVKAYHILCEHVLEHFTEQDNRSILTLAHKHLQPGGNIRIAVPDKNHPNDKYIEYVRPNGSGAGADDHRSFWDYKSYSKLLEELGYEVTLLEYCTFEKEIITSNYDISKGQVHRSLSYNFKMYIDNYSSLIIDAKKK